MKNKFAGILAGIVLISGLTWGIAEGVKATKANSSGSEKNAISVNDNMQCEKPIAECAKHEGMSHENSSGAAQSSTQGSNIDADADCPRKEHCPKDGHDSKSGECCKKKSSQCCKKKSIGSTKTGNSPASEAAIAKPSDASKTKN